MRIKNNNGEIIDELFSTEMTTQAAAELPGCSRPHIVRLLEEGKIPYTKVGKHRRIKYEEVLDDILKRQMKSTWSN